MDIKKLTQEVLLKNMTPEQQMAVLDSVQASVKEAKAVQKQKIAENVDLVLQALKRIEADMIKRVDGSAQIVEDRVKTIKDGKDGKNGIDGKAGRDGKDGKNGIDGRNGKDGINGVSGERGQDGVGVQNAHIDFDGSLIIALTNGQELNVGEVVPFDVAEKIRVIGNGGGTSQFVIDTLASLQTQIDNFQALPSQTGNAGKFLTTDGTNPSWASIAGGLSYQGTWNASTNSPTLASSAGTNGYYYIVGTAGSTNLNGITDWQVGDWLLFNGTTWQKLDQTNLVTSVAGRTGSVVLSASDISGLGTLATQNANEDGAGILVAPSITITGSGSTVDVGSTTANVHSVANWMGTFNTYTIPAATGLALTDNSANYLVVNYNSGSPIYQITTDVTTINGSNIIGATLLWRSGTEVHYQAINWGLATAARLNRRIVQTQRYERASGLALGETAGNVITVASGTIWYGVNEYPETAQTSASSNAEFWFHSSGVWTKSNVSTYNNTQYDNGTNLTTLSAGRYGVNWVYRYLDGSGLPKIAFILGSGNYSQAQAVASSPPTPPAVLGTMAILVGRIIVIKNGTTASQIDSAFTQVFSSTAVTDHNDLANIQGGTTNEYYHLTSAQQVIATQAATTSQSGYLTSTDWNTFNGKGSGTVTSVTGTAPIVSSGGNTPAISLAASYGDTQNPYASKTANYILAAPNGSSGAPTFRAIVAADIPTLNQNTTGSAATVTTTINSGVVATTQSAGDNSTKVATTAYVNAVTGTNGITGFKNRIINGAMMIDQRNAGASITPTDGQYTLDRFKAQLSAASKYSVQQNAGSVTPPVGFAKYLGVTSLSSYSVGAGDYFLLTQLIEGFNTADLAWGTASASTVTLSFWVRSSLTGTFGGSFQNASGNRSYPFTYSISAANTWEQKTIPIAGDTTGTWIGATNGIGVTVNFNLGTGTTYSGTAGSWAGSNYASATGATSVVGTNGATFYITGVQLEKGSTATSFDYRPYGTELVLCQRYYEKSTNYISSGIAGATGTQLCQVFYKTTKRASATVSLLGSVGGSVIQAGIDGFQISRANDNPYATGGYTGEVEL